MSKKSFDADEIRAFEPAEKIGLIASRNPEGLPHLTFISSIMASKPNQLTLREFCKGKGKEYIQQSPDVGFLIMTLDRRVWRGKARWTHLKKDGPEYEMYNNME